MKYLYCLFLLFTVTPVFADPPKVVPVPAADPDKWTKMEGAVTNKLFVMAAEPASRWKTLNSTVELRQFDAGKTGVFLATVAGTYQIIVIGPSGDINQLEVVVTDNVEPKPPTPSPVDEFTVTVKKLYDAEAGEVADKKEAAKDLAELYRQVATLAEKAEVKTSGDLLKRYQDAANTLIGKDKLITVRKFVSGKVSTLLPTNAELSDSQRKAVADLFRKLAVVLDQLGN